MAASEQDIAQKIADVLKDDALLDIIEAKDRYNANVANVVNFAEAQGVTVDDDEDQWRKLTGDSNRDLNQMTQARSQKLALYLWESNLLANRIIELPIAYILAEGVKLVSDNPEYQDLLDRFWHDPINVMDLKLPKKVRELSLFGGQYWPAFTNEDTGHVRLGYLDPAQVATVVTDPNNIEQPIGVVTVKDRKGRAKRYKVIINGEEDDLFPARTREIRETFDDGELFYFKINDLSNGKFGRSDLLAQIDWLDSYDQFLFGEMDRAQFLRAFIWSVKLMGATPEEVAAYAKKLGGAPKAGSVRVHNDSEEWSAETPSLNAVETGETARLLRNHTLGGATLPEHWFGGGGDVNRSTGDSMGEPTFKLFTMRQKYLGYILECVGYFVIRKKMQADNKSLDDMELINSVRAEFPEMIARDTTKYASALQQVTVAVTIAISNKIMTKKTAIIILQNLAARLGTEFDAEAELNAAITEAGKEAEDDVFTTPPGADDDTNEGADA